MKELVRKFIRKQVGIIFEVEQTLNPVEKIKQMDADIKASEEEVKNIEKQKKDIELQQQNKQKVVGSQVGTLGDDKSKNIKTQDVKRDVEIYKKEKEKIIQKGDDIKQNIELKKAQLDSEKVNLANPNLKPSSTPSAPVAP